MNPRFNIRELNESDYGQVLQLFSKTWGRNESESYFRWQNSNPIGPWIAMVAEDSSQRSIIGLLVVVPYRVHIPGETFTIGHVCETVIAKELQGHGIYAKLWDAAVEVALERGYVGFYGPPNLQAFPNLVRRHFTKPFGRFPCYYRNFNVERPTRGLLRKLGSATQRTANLVEFGLRNLVRSARKNGWTIEPTRTIPGGMDVLWQKLRNRPILSFDRSLEVLKWRHEERADYRDQVEYFVCRARDSRILAFAVTYNKYNTIQIADLMFEDSDGEPARALVEFISLRGAAQRRNGINFRGHDHGQFRRVFVNFTRSPEKELVLVFHRFGEKCLRGWLFNEGNWIMTQADTDLV